MGSSSRTSAQAVSIVRYATALLAGASLLLALQAQAAGTPAQKCEASKLKASGKKGSCRAKAAAKAVSQQLAPDYSGCEEKFTDGFAKAEDKAEGECPTTGDAAAVEASIDACLDLVFIDLGGVPGLAESKCKGSKLKAVGKKFDCTLKAESKSATTGDPADLSKCVSGLPTSFTKAENGDDCETMGDAGTIATAVDSCTSAVLASLAGSGFPANPDDYVAEESTYLDSLGVPAVVSGVPECCRDFGAISKDFITSSTNNMDNALAVLAASLVGLGVDLEQLLTDSLADGSLVVLFDHRNLDGGALPDDFTLVQLLGSFDAGTTPVDGQAGNGQFLIDPSSFVGATGTPLAYTGATMDVASMDSDIFSLELSIPFGFFTLDVTAQEALVTGVPGAITAAGVPYTGGELSGYITLAEIFAGLNGILSSPQCACLGVTGDVFFQTGSTWNASCVSNAATLCTLPGEDICVTLAGTNILNTEVCAILPSVLPTVSDLDLNSNSADGYEGMSLGLTWTGQNAQINGVEP